MIVIENVVFLLVVLGQDNLLSPEEGAILLVKVHFLLIADAVL